MAADFLSVQFIGPIATMSECDLIVSHQAYGREPFLIRAVRATMRRIGRPRAADNASAASYIAPAGYRFFCSAQRSHNFSYFNW